MQARPSRGLIRSRVAGAYHFSSAGSQPSLKIDAVTSWLKHVRYTSPLAYREGTRPGSRTPISGGLRVRHASMLSEENIAITEGIEIG